MSKELITQKINDIDVFGHLVELIDPIGFWDVQKTLRDAGKFDNFIHDERAARFVRALTMSGNEGRAFAADVLRRPGAVPAMVKGVEKGPIMILSSIMMLSVPDQAAIWKTEGVLLALPERKHELGIAAQIRIQPQSERLAIYKTPGVLEAYIRNGEAKTAYEEIVAFDRTDDRTQLFKVPDLLKAFALTAIAKPVLQEIGKLNQVDQLAILIEGDAAEHFMSGRGRSAYLELIEGLNIGRLGKILDQTNLLLQLAQNNDYTIATRLFARQPMPFQKRLREKINKTAEGNYYLDEYHFAANQLLPKIDFVMGRDYFKAMAPEWRLQFLENEAEAVRQIAHDEEKLRLFFSGDMLGDLLPSGDEESNSLGKQKPAQACIMRLHNSFYPKTFKLAGTVLSNAPIEAKRDFSNIVVLYEGIMRRASSKDRARLMEPLMETPELAKGMHKSVRAAAAQKKPKLAFARPKADAQARQPNFSD